MEKSVKTIIYHFQEILETIRMLRNKLLKHATCALTDDRNSPMYVIISSIKLIVFGKMLVVYYSTCICSSIDIE